MYFCLHLLTKPNGREIWLEHGSFALLRVSAWTCVHCFCVLPGRDKTQSRTRRNRGET